MAKINWGDYPLLSEKIRRVFHLGDSPLPQPTDGEYGCYEFHVADAERLLRHCMQCTGMDNCYSDTRGVMPLPLPKVIGESEFAPRHVILQWYSVPCHFNAGYEWIAAEQGKFISDVLKGFVRCKEVQRAADIVESYIRNRLWERDRWLVLSGTLGTGKTHLASCVHDAVIRAGRTAVFVTAPEVIGSGVGADDELGKHKFDMAANADVLILDDLGVEHATQWSFSRVGELIDFRYRRRAPTVITTNLRLSEFAKRYGERVTDRIGEMGNWVTLTGDSYRGVKGEAHFGE